jgi:WD40 repeat protein
MAEHSQPRRFLIATGVTKDLSDSGVARIARSVGQVCRLFESKFEYERATTLDLDPSLQQMRTRIREFVLKCDPADIVALYHTGHADVVAGSHRLWMGDTDDPVAGTLLTSELAELMLVESPVRNLLFILDACFAGQGSAEALLASMRSMGHATGKTVAVITAAHPREQVRAGDFARLFERAVDHPATAGHEPRYLSVGAITAHMSSDPERMKWQTISHSLLFGISEPLPFLPNPRYNTALHGLDLATQVQIEQDEFRKEDLRSFFYPRARGVDLPQDSGWQFVGRNSALRDLSAWLTDSVDLRTTVITGDPGSGKSAVIARLYILSHPDWNKTVPRQGVPADTFPPEGAIDVAIHARGLTSQQVLTALCAAARVEAATPGDFLRARSGKPMVAAIDAIDEAVDPDRLVSAILNPLIDAGPKVGLRMLLGTRPYLLDRLSTAARHINLDDGHYADPESLCAYAARCLQFTAPASQYTRLDPTRLHAIAEAIAQAAGRSFLVGRIVSRRLAVQETIPDPADPAWRASLPGTAAEAMQQDLEGRLGANASRARDLLRPLAYAWGNGLPWEDLWAPLASFLSGRRYSDEDLIWLRRQAGSYVVEALEAGRSVYRLYHAALAEYLRHGQDDRLLHSKYVEFLIAHVPHSQAGDRAWHEAHPYVLSHLATHAAAAGELKHLILDPDYLTNAVPAGLRAALPTARDPDSRQVAVAYERALHHLRSKAPQDRLSYLELSAHRAQAGALLRSIAARPMRRRWSVPWTRWPEEHPHRVLDGHKGAVRGVICVTAKPRAPIAASVGDDGTLRTWDPATGEPLGVYKVSRAALTDIALAHTPGHIALAVVLSTDGSLTTYELPTASQALHITVLPGWRRLLRFLLEPELALRCITLPDGTPAAVTGGRRLATTIRDISTGATLLELPTGLLPAGMEFRELVNHRPVIAYIDSTAAGQHRLLDPVTGRDIPDIRGFRPSIQLRYYCLHDGRPVLAIRTARYTIRDYWPLGGHDARQIVWDLTAPEPRAVPFNYRRQTAIKLYDGRTVSLPDEYLQSIGLQPDTTPHGVILTQLCDTATERYLARLPFPNATFPIRPTDAFPFVVAISGQFIIVLPEHLTDHASNTLVLTGHTAQVTGVDVVGADGDPIMVVSSSLDGTVRSWDLASDINAAPAPTTAEEPRGTVIATFADHTGTLGLVTSMAENVLLIELETGNQVGQLKSGASSVCAAACGQIPGVGPAAITFGTDNMMRIWRIPDGAEVASVPADPIRWPVRAQFVRSPDRPLLVSCGHGDKVIVWDIASRRIRNVLGKHTGWTAALACGIDNQGSIFGVTGGHDNRLNFWDLVKGRRIGHRKIVARRAFFRDSNAGRARAIQLVRLSGPQIALLVLCEDGKIRVFLQRGNSAKYRSVTVLGERGASVALTQLKDGRDVVIVGGEDGRIRIWDLADVVAPSRLRRGKFTSLLEIDLDAPVDEVSAISDDMMVASTANGLAAVQLHCHQIG